MQLTLNRNTQYAKLKKHPLPLTESVMRLRAALMRLSTSVKQNNTDAILKSKIKFNEESCNYREAASIANKNSLIFRNLIVIGNEALKSGQEILDKAVHILRLSLKSF